MVEFNADNIDVCGNLKLNKLIKNFKYPCLKMSFCGEFFIIQQEYKLTVNIDGKDIDIFIPKGFFTDFASVPHLVKVFFSDKNINSLASIVHDYLYKTKQVDRKTADKVLKKIMIMEGNSVMVSSLFYNGVRWFGAKNYGSDKNKIHNTCKYNKVCGR